MGIPVGWNIVRDEAKEKDVLRADLTGARSPIRRRTRGRAARPRREWSFEPLEPVLLSGHTLRFDGVQHAPRLSHARTQLPPAPPVPELRARDFDRDELQPRPLRTADGPADGPADADGTRPLPALTPGFAPARPRSPVVIPGEHTRSDGPRPRRSRLLDRFIVPDDDERYSDDDDDETPRTNDDDGMSRTNAVSHPPLRRVGHRRIADGPLPASSLRESWSPVSTVDGLGDRERSNSMSSTSSNLPWQNFLSTVVPDPVPPTAESSFASSAASASFAASSSRASSSNSNSAPSEHTHVTIPSRRPTPGAVRRRGEEMSESFARACESSDEGDSTASDTEDEASANPLTRRRMRPSYFAAHPPSPRRYGRSVRDQGVDARRYVRSYYANPNTHGALYQLDGSQDAQADAQIPVVSEDEQEADSFATVAADDADHSTSPASPLDQELRDARSLLERLTRRGDIGDDFWASVGLTRSFADGVERVQERGRF
ncbi:hypothetical protein C7974DRAFT_389048 [Boeremia exigua]|uniref:uncharacterized protein n=1 Tax=Boeremia exigua TaxID=749465 RepID=UPI001E8DC5C6|nr:uncharacterized protein C7974DRAFT_389048 [Boeremia exigua]KAH6639714.1 hypothetical protein C7974DRAFT_389048 [Boeremia exigua]